jgi:hypothetical protein
MTVKRKYLIPKVSDEGEDVVVDGQKFDSLLNRLAQAPPLPLEKLRQEPVLAMRRRKKAKE